MAIYRCIFILTVIMAVMQQIQGACVCNEKGVDGCATCSGVIRPKPKHLERPTIGLPPVGDNCWCSRTLIQPASLPKPSKVKPLPLTFGSSVLPLQPTYTVPQVNYVQAAVGDNSPPADPISISLAKQAGKAIEVPEAKLAYGFVRKPINGLPKVFISSIKEENLYALANDVITLKKPTTQVRKIEEDYPEPEEEEPAPEDYEPPSLTYKQLGYEPEQFHNPAFIQLPSRAVGNPIILDHFKADFGCGFEPGRITKLKERAEKFQPTNYLLKY